MVNVWIVDNFVIKIIIDYYSVLYKEDVLTEDKGECVICLEDMLNGDKIARLPCLCIYHKK